MCFESKVCFTMKQNVLLSKAESSHVSHTWRTCLPGQERNVIVFCGICHYISDLVCYGRDCVAVSGVHFILRWRKIEVVVQRIGRGRVGGGGVDEGLVCLEFISLAGVGK